MLITKHVLQANKPEINISTAKIPLLSLSHAYPRKSCRTGSKSEKIGVLLNSDFSKNAVGSDSKFNYFAPDERHGTFNIRNHTLPVLNGKCPY